MLGSPGDGAIVREQRDPLARLGSEDSAAALTAMGRRPVVADPGASEDDLVQDRSDVLTSIDARPSGRRSARNRAGQALKAASEE